ncbi:hypothetical protein L596_028684 [Steinernema carpocapsae]|uniref:Uncharacterized protein n=1 Tax=Steinernema carpocapsae TaxID=34508 RepID=A0A4U5LZ31_STECR|nr:hypothetical protein L596_028684 [Steinernema carpocapsae]
MFSTTIGAFLGPNWVRHKPVADKGCSGIPRNRGESQFMEVIGLEGCNKPGNRLEILKIAPRIRFRIPLKIAILLYRPTYPKASLLKMTLFFVSRPVTPI